MKTHDLLRTALALAGMADEFRLSGPTPGVVFPHGWFTRELRPRPDAARSELRLAASDLGVARVELTLLLAGEADDAMAAAVHEELDFLWAVDYQCHFPRTSDGSRLQLKAHIFIFPQGASDDAFLAGVATAAGQDDLAAWLRLSVAICRKVLLACASQR